MRTQSEDTNPEVERVQIELLRKAGMARRLQLGLELSGEALEMAQRGIRRANPYAFTEQGVAMLSSVLHSKRAVQVNIAIMRAFVRLREMLAGHHELAQKLAALEKKYDAQFKVVFNAIRNLMRQKPSDDRNQIGFRITEKKRT